MYVHQAMHFLFIDELLHIVKHFLGFLQLGVQDHTQTKKKLLFTMRFVISTVAQ